jgi:hypothetical protein
MNRCLVLIKCAEPPEKIIGPPAASPSSLSVDPAIQHEPHLNQLLPSKSPAYLRPPRNVPARIDAAAASMSNAFILPTSQSLICVDRSFLPVDQLTPQSAYSNYSDGQSSALGTPSTQVTTPSSMFSRRPVGGLQSRTPSPPSPNLASNLDTAFPYFPVKKDNDSRSRETNHLYRSDEKALPLSPRVDVMQRMNTIAPGPFGASTRRQGEKTGPGVQSSQIRRNVSADSSTQLQFRNQNGREHFRKASNASSLHSQSSVQSDRSLDRIRALAREETGSRHAAPLSRPRRPTDAVDRFLNDLPTQDEIGEAPMFSPEMRSKTFPETQQSRFPPGPRSAKPPPSAPPTQSEFFANRSYEDSERPTTSANTDRKYGGFTASADPAVQPLFTPQRTDSPSGYQQPTTNAGRLRSKTVTRPSRPTDTPNGEWFERPRPSPTPPSEPFKPSMPQFFQPSGIISAPSSAAARNRSKTVTRPSGPFEIPRFDRRIDDAPPLPYSTPLVRKSSNRSQRSESHHTPTDSDSSHASSSSTPPTSDGSSISRSGSSSENGDKRGDYSERDLPPIVRSEILIPPIAPSAGGFFRSPESPMDPAIQKGIFRDGPRLPVNISPPRNRPGALRYGEAPRMDISPPRTRLQPPRYGGQPDIPSDTSPPRNRPEAAVYSNDTRLLPPITSPTYRPDLTNTSRDINTPPIRQLPSKGDCRACGTPIHGKSVKAADGRLSGRFHKECFSCKTCAAPFPTGEFYVLQNAPYCSRHYHELNGSVCKSCNGGIEGQYLETANGEKFHTSCFECGLCGVALKGDYWEVDGRPVCERHAYTARSFRGAGQAPVVVGERRRTKLMMI